MNRTLVQALAIVFVSLAVCPLTAPFSTFDASSPHALPSDSHIGVAAVKDLTDDQPTMATAPILLCWSSYRFDTAAAPYVQSVQLRVLPLIALRI
jgi:hypothetical protein